MGALKSVTAMGLLDFLDSPLTIRTTRLSVPGENRRRLDTFHTPPQIPLDCKCVT